MEQQSSKQYSKDDCCLEQANLDVVDGEEEDTHAESDDGSSTPSQDLHAVRMRYSKKLLREQKKIEALSGDSRQSTATEKRVLEGTEENPYLQLRYVRMTEILWRNIE